MSNDIKAKAIQEFVSLMAATYESGFILTNVADIADIYSVAEGYCDYNYGVKIPSLSDIWGEETAKIFVNQKLRSTWKSNKVYE